MTKKEFLQKYNSDRSEKTALTQAINASVRRNCLYQNNLNTKDREQIKDKWKETLIKFGKKYENHVSEEEFVNDIEEIKKEMKELPGKFKISHAQKSLSVYLKHLWCLDKIQEPPVCPVDRKILEKAGAPVAKRAWTRIDNVKDYKEQLEYIKIKAEESNKSIATWELYNFSNSKQ
jgi:hypothetical protein